MEKFEKFQKRFNALELIEKEAKALEATLGFKDGLYHNLKMNHSRCAQKKLKCEIKTVNVYDVLPFICKNCLTDSDLLTPNAGINMFLYLAETANLILLRQESVTFTEVNYEEIVNSISSEKENNYQSVCSYLGGASFHHYLDSTTSPFSVLVGIHERINKNFYALPKKLKEHFEDEANKTLFLEMLISKLLPTDNFIGEYVELKALKDEMLKAQKLLMQNSKRVIISITDYGTDKRLQAYLEEYHATDNVYINVPKIVYDYMNEHVPDFSYYEVLVLSKPLEVDVLENFVSLRKSFLDKTFKEVLQIAKTV